MERDEYAKIAAVGERMWWFRALHRNILVLLDRSLVDRNGILLDDGCGAGGFLRKFCKAHPAMTACGIDMEQSAIDIAGTRSDARFVIGDANELPFADGVFAACISADIIYHGAARPKDVIGEALRCLKPKGILVISVPAYEWMFSAHDERVAGVRRYTKKSLSRTLTDAGFEIEYATYWNTLLFPLMVMRRKIMSPADGESDLKFMPAPVEVLFNLIMSLETILLRGLRTVGLSLPLGGSVMVVARRP